MSDPNIAHYDSVYSNTNVSYVVKCARNYEAFLRDATSYNVGWAGLYRDGFAARLKGMHVLELGAGDGLNALVMAQLGADVTAIDISPESARVISRSAAEAGLSDRVHALAGDFTTMVFVPTSFDFVVGKAILHHLTPDVEESFLRRSAELLKPTGEAIFIEPAVNSRLLDFLRWLVPVRGRPSLLRRKAFQSWQAADHHPVRDHSTRHYLRVASRHFKAITMIPLGGLGRFPDRLLHRGKLRKRLCQLALRLEGFIPRVVHSPLARDQYLRMVQPKHDGSGIVTYTH